MNDKKIFDRSIEKKYLKIGTAKDLDNKKEKIIYRCLEILPGFFSFSILFSAVIFSWKKPFWTAIFIISFDFYWLLRTIYFSLYLRSGYKKMKQYQKINWLEKLKKENPFQEINNRKIKWTDIYHLIILPVYKEPLEIIKATFLSLKESNWPKEKMIVVLACEEKTVQEMKKVAYEIKKKFGKIFFKFLVTWHPTNLPGEIPGHGSNDAWASKKAKELIIDPLKIPYETIIVSFFDADTTVFPNYFSCLTWHYLTTKKPTRTSFQPIPLYLNNIWQAPVFSRIFAFSSTFWHTMNQERPEKLITFSSHSMSFKALVDVDFKQTNVVSDDSRIFWQCFLYYNGDYKVQPIYYPVSMDANSAENFFKTIINIYKQQRRWAYGVGEIPYFLFGFLKNKKIPLRKKFLLTFELLEGHISWAVAPILIFCLGWLPLLLGGEEFSQSLISYNLPKITSQILTVTTLGLVLCAYLSLLLLPPKPKNDSRFKYFTFAFAWILFPIITIFFTSLPALDAQARWLLGKYMGFWPTEKVRKK